MRVTFFPIALGFSASVPELVSLSRYLYLCHGSLAIWIKWKERQACKQQYDCTRHQFIRILVTHPSCPQQVTNRHGAVQERSSSGTLDMLEAELPPGLIPEVGIRSRVLWHMQTVGHPTATGCRLGRASARPGTEDPAGRMGLQPVLR